MRNAYKNVVGKTEGKRPLDGLKWIFRRRNVWTGLKWLRGYGPVAGSREYVNEPSGSIKDWTFLDQ
jgi:hypothetical protein